MNQQIEQTDLKRTMKSRHLFMIALGGVIGTGYLWDLVKLSIMPDLVVLFSHF